MYCITKILNNNALLATEKGKSDERILLGKGIGFGKRTGDFIEEREGIQVYTPVGSEKRSSAMQVVNTIDPVYIEAAGRIIEEAEKVFDSIKGDILLPLADHIAFAAHRAQNDTFFANPLIQDIKILFGKEYAVALECRRTVEELTGYQISDDEAGFIALHIHSGLSGEQVSDTLRMTQIIDESIQIVGECVGYRLKKASHSYIRLMSHLYYMVIRSRTGEAVNVELNDFMKQKYPKAMRIAQIVCGKMESRLNQPLASDEQGFLAVHIQRLIAL